MLRAKGRSIVFTKAISLYLGLIIVAFLWYLIGLASWSSYHTAIGYHSLVVFLATASAAVASFALTDYRRITSIFVISALLFIVFVETSAAINHLFNPISPLDAKQPLALFEDIFELHIISVLVFVGTLLYGNKPKDIPAQKVHKYGIPFLIVILPILFYGLLFFTAFQYLDLPLIQIIGTTTAAATVALFISSAALWYRSEQIEKQVHSSFVIVTFLCLATALVPLTISLYYPGSLWTLSFTLVILGVLAFFLSVSIPFATAIGLDRTKSYSFSLLFTLVGFIPLITAMSVDRSSSPEIIFLNLGVFMTIHSGAAVLSGVLALLLFLYVRSQHEPTTYPLVLIFISWMIIELNLLSISYIPNQYYIENSRIHYITGMVATLILLSLAIRANMVAKKESIGSSLPKLLTITVSIVMLTFWIGQFVQQQVYVIDPSIASTPLGRSVLMSLTVVDVFLYIILLYILFAKSRGKMTAEIVGAGILAMWIVPSLLSSNYNQWTIGWWTGEVLILIGLLLGPLLLGFLYISELSESVEARKRAELYSDILVHDISNYHQTAITALGLLDHEGVSEAQKESAFKDLQASLVKAESLVSTVRKLGRAAHTRADSLVTMDLVKAIKTAFAQTKAEFPEMEIDFSMNSQEGECFVSANELLVDLFLNLFNNALKYSRDKKVIRVEIAFQHGDAAWWVTRVIDHGMGLSPELKDELFSRYMLGARGTGLGLYVVQSLVKSYRGEITVEDRVHGNHTKGAIFNVRLPAVHSD